MIGEMDTVLIAEDNATFMKILRAGLRKYEDKFEIITAKDGQEAIEVLGQQPISLLVTDLRMPKVDGLTLLAYVNENHPKMPCIVMTAHGTPQMKERLQRDVLHYVEKPFKAEELAQTIVATLNRDVSLPDADIPDGALKGISIASFLQMIEMEEKTCLLEIDTPKGKGFFYFHEGELHDAIWGHLKGLEAALKMIPMENAKIRFRNPPKRKVKKRIKIRLMALIMEAMKTKDEFSDGAEKVRK